MGSVLVVCAVEAERDAILAAGSAARVLVGGVGPAAVAAATAAALAALAASPGADLVLSAGIGGGFAPVSLGSIAVASSIVFADLGAETPDGFVPVSALGFGEERYEVDASLAADLAARTGGRVGTIVTVATVTGTATTTSRLQARFPDVVAEGMEGAGVAAAARVHGVPFAELRAISNLVGPRDRDAWEIPRALKALGAAVAAVAS